MEARNTTWLNNVALLGSLSEDFDVTTLFPYGFKYYSPRFRGIVINSTERTPKDGNVHIFLDHSPQGVAYYDMLYAPDDSYGFGIIYIVQADQSDESAGNSQWNHERIYEYLIGEGFTEQEAIYSYFRPDCSFNKFAAVAKASTVNAYVKSIIQTVKAFWEKKHPDQPFPPKYEEEMMNYEKEFHIMFMSNEVNPDPRSNYQLLEYIGDQVGWSAMNPIFIGFLESKPSPKDNQGNVIELNKNNITSMHRDLFSRNTQSKLARKLGVKQFIQTTKESISNKMYGDIYESMLGTFLLVDYFISTRVRFETGSKLFNFHIAFLEWSYESVDLTKFEMNPYYTQFNQNATAIFGGSYFKHVRAGDNKITKVSAANQKKLIESAKTFTFITGKKETRDMSRAVADIIRRATESIDQGEDELDYIDNERANFNQINAMIDNIFGREEIDARKTMDNMKGWDKSQQEEFLELMHEQHGNDFVLNRHDLDKHNTSYYWVVESTDKKRSSKLLYTTENYTNPEDPDLLISIIRQKMGKVDIEAAEWIKLTPKQAENRTYVTYVDNGRPMTVMQVISGVGSRDDSMEQMLRDDASMVLHISVRNYQPDSTPDDGKHYDHIDYTPHPSDIFVKGFDHIAFFKQFSNTVRYRVNEKTGKITAEGGKAITVDASKREIIRNIGDRFTNRSFLYVSLMRHGIMNEHHLTNVKNYLRSKILKAHFTLLMREYRECDPSEKYNGLDFDEYIGFAPEVFENQLYELFKNIRIDDSYIETPTNKLKKIRYAVDRHTYEKGDSVFQTVKSTKTNDSWLVYESSTEVRLACKIGFRDFMILRDLFAKYCIQYEMMKKDKTTLLNRLNSVYRNTNGYDKLRQIMEIRNFEDWEIIETKKFDMRFTLKYKNDDTYHYITERNFEEIIKTLTNTRIRM